MKYMYDDLLSWCDIDKLKISEICQQYSRERSSSFEHEKHLVSQNIVFHEHHVNKQLHFY